MTLQKLISKFKNKLFDELNTLIQKYLSSNVRIIVYHSIGELDKLEIKAHHHVNTDEFEKQIKYLKSKYNILSISEFLAGKTGPKKRSILITIDDGYKDIISKAYKVLEDNEVHATLFICTSLIDNKDLLWRDKLRIIKKMKLSKKFISFISSSYKKEEMLDLNVQGLHHWSKKNSICSNYKMHNLIDDFFKENDLYKTAKDLSLYINTRDICKMDFLDFQSHSHLHPKMTSISQEKQRNEILTSNKILEDLGCDITSFALPFDPYDEQTIKVLIEEKINTVFSVHKDEKTLFFGDVTVYNRRLAPTTLSKMKKIF